MRLINFQQNCLNSILNKKFKWFQNITQDLVKPLSVDLAKKQETTFPVLQLMQSPVYIHKKHMNWLHPYLNPLVRDLP
jgi:hypothetical protein